VSTLSEHRPPTDSYPDFGAELASPAVLADPHPVFHRMRREEPAHRSRALGAWLVTRYDDVLRGLRDPRLSSDRIPSILDGQVAAGDRGSVKDFERTRRAMMVNMDGPAHHRLRRLISPAFSPAAIDATLPMIQEAVDRLVDRAGASARLDVVADYAAPLPTLVICELLGIPAEDRPSLRAWSDDAAKLMGATHGASAIRARTANDAVVNLERYFLRLIAERRRRPGDDLLSLLIRGEEEGRMTSEELSAQCQMLLVGGHLTLIDQLSNAVHALLGHPEQLRKLRLDPSLIGSAIKEVLRYDPPLTFVHRVAAADLELGGAPVRRGERVLLALAAANRDPGVFTDPDTFDIERAGNRHLAFGAGPHACAGGGLARRELEVALLTLFRRLPRLALDPENPPRRRTESLMFRGFQTLPVLTSYTNSGIASPSERIGTGRPERSRNSARWSTPRWR
jgi:cytochrome P450